MKKSKMGFASMDPVRQVQLARKGGQNAHKSGKAFEWNSEQAAAAGRIGGKRSAILSKQRAADKKQLVTNEAL